MLAPHVVPHWNVSVLAGAVQAAWLAARSATAGLLLSAAAATAAATASVRIAIESTMSCARSCRGGGLCCVRAKSECHRAQPCDDRHDDKTTTTSSRVGTLFVAIFTSPQAYKSLV